MVHSGYVQEREATNDNNHRGHQPIRAALLGRPMGPRGDPIGHLLDQGRGQRGRSPRMGCTWLGGASGVLPIR